MKPKEEFTDAQFNSICKLVEYFTFLKLKECQQLNIENFSSDLLRRLLLSSIEPYESIRI